MLALYLQSNRQCNVAGSKEAVIWKNIKSNGCKDMLSYSERNQVRQSRDTHLQAALLLLHVATLLRCYKSTLLQRYAATALRCYGATRLQRYVNLVLRDYDN